MIGRFMPSVFPPIVAGIDSRSWPCSSALPPDRARGHRRRVQRGGAPGPVRSRGARRLPHRRTVAGQESLGAARSTRRRSGATRCVPGITFTYLGLKVDEPARVVMRGGTRRRNLFAAGEVMAGNILRRGYLAGIGMTIGTVFGRIAGAQRRRCRPLIRWRTARTS